MATMLNKTIKEALTWGRARNITDSETFEIQKLIESAFYAYGQEWKHFHTPESTNSQWSYFYNELTETNTSLNKIAANLVQYGKPKDQWTANFCRVIEILQIAEKRQEGIN